MDLPFLLYPNSEESPSSWLIRLARKHHTDLFTFCDYFEINDLLNTHLDVEVNWDILTNRFSNLNIDLLPIRLVDFNPDFKWKNGKSNWILNTSKSGPSTRHSTTKICPDCLKNDGYISFKWKFSFYFGCLKCGHELIDKCNQCASGIFPLISDQIYINENNSFKYCFYCGFDLTQSVPPKMNAFEVDSLIVIDTAIRERNLFFLQAFLFFKEVLIDKNNIPIGFKVNEMEIISLVKEFPNSIALFNDKYNLNKKVWFKTCYSTSNWTETYLKLI